MQVLFSFDSVVARAERFASFLQVRMRKKRWWGGPTQTRACGQAGARSGFTMRTAGESCHARKTRLGPDVRGEGGHGLADEPPLVLPPDGREAVRVGPSMALPGPALRRPLGEALTQLWSWLLWGLYNRMG